MIRHLQTTVLLPVESAINHFLDADPHSQRLFARHAGRVLEIESLTPPLRLYVLFLEKGVRLYSTFAGTAAATVRGSGATLMHALVNKGSLHNLDREAVEIVGDSTFVQDIYRVLSDMEINWQDTMSVIAGDTFTGQLESTVSQLRRWATHFRLTVKSNIDDYLHEELRVSPSRLEVESFSRRLDAMRLTLDRLEARKNQIDNSLAGN